MRETYYFGLYPLHYKSIFIKKITIEIRHYRLRHVVLTVISLHILIHLPDVYL